MIRGQEYTKQQRKDHMREVAALGCLYCLLYEGRENDWVQVHHADTGMHRRKNDMRTVGLCPEHHGGKESFVLTKSRREIETRLLAYVAEHCACPTCKEKRK